MIIHPHDGWLRGTIKMGFWTAAEGRKGLTLNLEYKAGSPCTSCYCYDDLLHVPNGEAGGVHECLIVDWIREKGIHTEHNQERRSGSG